MSKCKLGSICTITSSKRIFENEYVSNGIPFIRGLEISDGSVLDENAKYECYISEKRYKELKETNGVPKKGDILITAVGTIGNLCYINKDIDFYFKDGNVIWFKDFHENVYSKFLFYFMKSAYFKKQLENSMIGAVQKALTMKMLSEINLDLPDYNTQVLIVKVLESIDNKIANNNKINTELEEMAKIIYDYWFLQFEFPNEEGKPYKSSGGKMVWNEELKREIPEGWEVQNIFDAMEVIYGYPFNTKLFSEKKGIPVIRIRDILNNSVSALTTESVNNRYLSKKKDLLIGMDGNFHMNFWAKDGELINQRIVRIRDEKVSTLQVYFQIEPFIKAKERNVAKSTVGHLSDKDIKSLNILISNNKKIYNFFDTILNIICNNKQENQELTSLRDFLLPLLMNGQVGFKEEAFA